MPPKVKFSREQIIEQAFSVAQDEGIEGITIRKVANRLGSSIAPIYVNFKAVDELKRAVAHKTFSIAQTMLEEREYQSFLGVGLATLRFAREYPLLFQDLVLKPNPYMEDYGPTLEHILSLMKADPALTGLRDETLMDLLMKMRIFTTGLSVMVSGMMAGQFSIEMQQDILDSTGADLIAAARLGQNSGKG